MALATIAIASPSYSQIVGGPAALNQIIQLVCPPDFTCDFALDKGETVIERVGGESKQWKISTATDNEEIIHILARTWDTPHRGPVATNIMIFTDRRVIELRLYSPSWLPEEYVPDGFKSKQEENK